jgi:ABC-2 type transport system permease protein
VLSALLYLTFTSLWNSLRQRLRRLRQPKYLFGALAGAAYFYFFVFGGAFRRTGARAAFGDFMPGGTESYVPFGAAALFIIVLLGWVFGRDRAAINFTEAETAFLFPAPLSRRGLLHYKLLRSQMGILFGVLILSFVFRRGAVLGGSSLMHAVGWWLILSTLNLHFIATSFVRERLFKLGLTRWRRFLLLGGGLLLLGGTWWLVVRQSEAAQTLAVGEQIGDYVAWSGRLLQLPPLGWLLVPFGWLVRPYLAPTWTGFLLATGPALLLLAAHYFWVMRSAVGFEEASIELAARNAQMIAAIRKGGLNISRAKKKKRSAPFPLGAHGWIPVAFLWKSLITLGPFYRLRTWLISAAAIVGVTTWLGRVPEYEPYLKAIGALSLMLGAYLLLFGPIFMRRNIVVILDQLEMTKSYPLPGWQIIAGELLTPSVVVTFIEWLFLLAAVMASGTIHGHSAMAGLLAGGAGAATGIALLVPPLIALMMSIPLAMMLYFPAWAKPGTTQSGGIENVGQGIIAMIGFILVLAVTLLPATATGGLAYFVTSWLLGPVAAVWIALVVASALLVFELATIVWWLGEKLDRFDLSREASH